MYRHLQHHLAENPKNEELSRVWASWSKTSHPTAEIPANFQITSASHISTNKLDRKISAWKPVWQELPPKSGSEGTPTHFWTCGPAAFPFSPPSANCLQTTARTFTHIPSSTIEVVMSWHRGLKHELYRKYRIFAFRRYFGVVVVEFSTLTTNFLQTTAATSTQVPNKTNDMVELGSGSFI